MHVVQNPTSARSPAVPLHLVPLVYADDEYRRKLAQQQFFFDRRETHKTFCALGAQKHIKSVNCLLAVATAGRGEIIMGPPLGWRRSLPPGRR